jgi:hypothetical protein
MFTTPAGKQKTSALVAFLLVAGCGGDDICDLAVDHLEACTGVRIQTLPERCNPVKAEIVLDTGCSKLAGASDALFWNDLKGRFWAWFNDDEGEAGGWQWPWQKTPKPPEAPSQTCEEKHDTCEQECRQCAPGCDPLACRGACRRARHDCEEQCSSRCSLLHGASSPEWPGCRAGCAG